MSHICFNLLLLLSFIVESSTTQYYYVRPTGSTSTSCPLQPCLTIDDITNSSAHYLKSHNTIFTFLPGIHAMQRPFAISNLHNISLRGVGNKHDVILQLGSNDSVICERILQLVCWTAVLNVTNVSRISISNITVDVTGDSYAGILLQNCYDVEVKQCTVFSSNSSYVIGLYVTNGNNITADMIETKNMAIGVMIYQTNRFTLQGSNISLSNYVGIYSFLTTCTSFFNLFLTRNGKMGIVLNDCHFVQIVQVTSSMTEVGIKVWNCVSTIMEKMSL